MLVGTDVSKATDDLFRQRTIRRPVSISGLGIHTGNRVQLTLRPAPIGCGVRFRRIDSGGIEIPAHLSQVSSLELATTLGRDDVTISTVEHLMAVVQVLSIDNLIVDLDGPEVPILDGSALPFLHLFEAVGIQAQDAWRRVVVVTRPLEVRHGDKHIKISPHPGLKISYTIDFQNPAIGRQSIELPIDRPTFERELASARTFAQWADVQYMREKGLALGGTSENCVVFDETGPINTELRFRNEPVRHKALDAVGDLALFGYPIWGHVEVHLGGHHLHYLLLEELRRQPQSWTWVSSERDSSDVGGMDSTATGPRRVAATSARLRPAQSHFDPASDEPVS